MEGEGRRGEEGKGWEGLGREWGANLAQIMKVFKRRLWEKRNLCRRSRVYRSTYLKFINRRISKNWNSNVF